MPIRRTWRLGATEIGFRKDLLEGDVAHPFVGLGEQHLRDPFARKLLAELYQELRGASLKGDLTNPTVARQAKRVLDEAFQRGELVAIRRKAEGGVSTQGTPGSNGNSGSSSTSKNNSAPPPSEPASEKTWVDVKLVDEEGEPVSGARYKLKLTDGSTREGTLDASGRVRVSNIDPGTCQIWFPDYDGSEWSRLS